MSDVVLVDTKRIAEMLSLTPTAVRRLVREGVLPCYRVGNLMRFSEDEVLAATRVRATEEETPEAPRSSGRFFHS